MTITFEMIFNFATAILIPLVAYLFNSLNKAREDLAEFKIEVNRDFISQKAVDRLEAKIDNMQLMINDLYRIINERKSDD